MPEQTIEELKSQNEYLVDVKVYERALRSEIPFDLPGSAYEGSLLIPGYQSWKFVGTEDELERFTRWSRQTSILKVIGVTDIVISNSHGKTANDVEVPLRQDPPDQR